MLEIDNVSVTFEKTVRAVRNLSLGVGTGSIYCMLGANGAGKTTTINLILNFIEPDSGKIAVNGTNVLTNPLEAKKHIAYVSENVMLYENYTAVQNLDFFAKIGGQTDYSDSDYTAILNRVGLQEKFHNRRLKTYSKGMRQKCGIAIAIAKDAPLILLDEPTSGLDPRSGREFLNILNELKSNGKAIFMTTHDIFRAKEIADRIGIMVAGTKVEELDHQAILRCDLETVYMELVGQTTDEPVPV